MNIQKILESLSPNERKILPHIKEKNLEAISKKSSLDKVSALRALEYLQNKKLINLSTEKKKIIEIDVNGALYRKKGLPERRILNVLTKKRILSLKEAQKLSFLSNDEFKASIGALKKKALIELKNGKIILNASPNEISKKLLEEHFLEALPLSFDSLSPEQLHALQSLKNRKNIIEISEKKKINIEITNLGKEIIKTEIKTEDLIEQITPKMLKNEKLWKRKKFRRYDVTSRVPEITGG
ncbi:MAG: hypothetical protein ACE5ES_03490, partial [Candidatus Nanoarchaeia archaeon]